MRQLQLSNEIFVPEIATFIPSLRVGSKEVYEKNKLTEFAINVNVTVVNFLSTSCKEQKSFAKKENRKRMSNGGTGNKEKRHNLNHCRLNEETEKIQFYNGNLWEKLQAILCRQ